MDKKTFIESYYRGKGFPDIFHLSFFKKTEGWASLKIKSVTVEYVDTSRFIALAKVLITIHIECSDNGLIEILNKSQTLHEQLNEYFQKYYSFNSISIRFSSQFPNFFSLLKWYLLRWRRKKTLPLLIIKN